MKNKKDPRHLFRISAYIGIVSAASSATHAPMKLSHTVTSTYRRRCTAAVVYLETRVKCRFQAIRERERESR
jgi:hypothetical protein